MFSYWIALEAKIAHPKFGSIVNLTRRKKLQLIYIEKVLTKYIFFSYLKTYHKGFKTARQVCLLQTTGSY